jgi:hypothetical protein
MGIIEEQVLILAYSKYTKHKIVLRTMLFCGIKRT